MTIGSSDITGVILAGGLSRRLHGTPKAFIELGGIPLIRHVFDALRPQVGAVLINANNHIERFQEYQVPVLADSLPGFRGPLAGIATAMAAATTPYLAVVPCDSPFIPRHLFLRLAAALEAHGSRISVVEVAGRWQPVFALLNCNLLADLDAHLAAEGRKIDHWYARFEPSVVDFTEEASSFLNINTYEDLRTAEQLFCTSTSS